MKLEFFADYFQFYLQDDDPAFGNLAEAWTEDATQRLRIAVAPGIVGVGTARNDTVKDLASALVVCNLARL